MISEELRERAIERLRAIASQTDAEQAHIDADGALLDLLSQAGADDVVKAWEAIVPKWYA